MNMKTLNQWSVVSCQWLVGAVRKPAPVIWLLVTLLSTFAYSQAFGATAGGTYYGLVVGVNQYSSITSLGGCVADAEDVLGAMTNKAKGVWSAENCYGLYDYDATLAAIRERFHALAETAQGGDTVLYYQSSHGGGDTNAFICATDEFYHDYDFAEDLMRFKTGVRVVVILDTCHSGGMFKSVEPSVESPWNFAANVEAIMSGTRTRGVKAGSNEPSIGWITACDYDQKSSEIGGRGVFTKAFGEAWRADGTDANGDGYNDFAEVFAVAAPLTTNENRQPQKLNDELLADVAAWEHSYHPPASDKWMEESAAMWLSTGTWSEPVEYDTDGRAYLGGEIGFTPYVASTGNVVTVETKARFDECTKDSAPGATAQAAVRLGTNGCFQVFSFFRLYFIIVNMFFFRPV